MMTWINNLNYKLAVKITTMVGTMWCAYLFVLIAIYGGQSVNWHDPNAAMSWLSQQFLQLVLLSVIMVGQEVRAKHEAIEDERRKQESDDLNRAMYKALTDEVAELKTMHEELHIFIGVKNGQP